MRASVLLFGSTLITSLGIVFPPLWFGVFPGLAIFFILLRDKIQGMLSAALCGLVFGVATGAAGTIWFLDTLPLSFLGIQDPAVQVTAVGMTWGYVATSLGLPVMAGATAIWVCRSSRWFPLYSTLLWGLTEIGRMWSFALTTWGPQSLFGPHFSTASVGYALAESEIFLRLAYPFGLDALNLCVAGGASILSTIPTISQNPSLIRAFSIPATYAALVFAFPSLMGGGPASVRSETLRFAVISEHIEDVRDFSKHHLVKQKIAEAASATPPVDVIVLPEEFSLTSIFWGENEASRFISDHFGQRDVLILNTRNDLYPEEQRNEAAESKKLVYDSTRQGELGRYHKQMLMPLGEYAPAFTHTFFSLLSDPELHLYLQDVATGFSDTRHLQVTEFRGIRFGGLLCSDMLSPHLYRSLTQNYGANVLVNLSNHFWFHGSKELYWKTVQMARVHAIQNRAPIVVSNNMAPSFVIDKQGEMMAEARWGAREVLYVDIPIEIKHQPPSLS